MQKRIGFFLISLLCIAAILITGCTNSGSSSAPVTTPAPTMTAAVSITTTDAPVQTAVPVTLVTTKAVTITTTATTATSTTDPILHRWIRQYNQNGKIYAYEFKFYPGGIVNYRTGPSTMVSDNIKLITPPTSEASGTWSSLGNNKYLIQILPSGHSGAQIIREYTLVPAHEEKAYPGIVIKDHIESSYETEAINKGQQRQPDEMYYPEQAKID